MADQKTTPDQPPADESLEDVSSTQSPKPTGDNKGSSNVVNATENDQLTPGKEKPAAEIAKEAAEKSKVKGIRRITSIPNFYLYANILLLLVAGGVIAFALVARKPAQPTKVNTSALTSDQLAKLQGSTTVVGDPKQILDIQSSTVFEGTVLTRSNLDVAGSLKVGGSLSIPSLTVSGQGVFGTLQAANDLTVGGALTLQGQLTVKNNLSVQGSGSFSGQLSAGQLNVSNLQLSGDLVISRHITTNGSRPGRSGGTALGTGGTASISGTDTAGTITINTGSSPPAGCFVTVNFAKSFSDTPHVVVSPSSSAGASLSYYTNRTSSSFSLCSASAPASGTNYKFDYIVID